MQIGIVGLGRMGGNMTERLLRGGHHVVVSDRNPQAIAQTVEKGAVGAEGLTEMTAKLAARRIVWLMIPAGDPVEAAIYELYDLLKPGDIVIDGGNSNYKDSIRHAQFLHGNNIHFLDAGTSGGIWGLTEGYCLMVGGDDDAVQYAEPIFKTLAPENGFLHVGPPGSGHFVKMVHNGIEYALMQSYAEGFELLKEGPFPELDLAAIAELWQHGSVVRSWLLELTAKALGKDPELSDIKAYVDDSGEGRWTVQEAIDHAVPAYTIAAALFARFASRNDNAYSLRLLAALRNEFGGHAVKKG